MSMTGSEAAGRRGLMAFAASRLKENEQLLKYFVIGCSASALDVGLFFLLYNALETTALVAHSVSVPTAVLFSFFVNARHNFRTNDYMALRLLSFAAACAIGYAIGYVVIAASAQLGFGANFGKIVSLPVVFVTQYLLNSKVTFRKVRAS